MDDEPVKLIAFPKRSVTNPFKLPPGGSQILPFTWSRCSVDWNVKDSKSLSETLNCQIKNNHVDYHQLSIMCKNPEGFEEALYTTNYVDDQDKIVINYYRTPEQKTEQCKKFLSRLTGYFDILERDQEVFNQTTWNVNTYAIVVIYKGEYFGHIYVWRSPIEPWLCFAMGIRGRVDAVFREDNLPNISSYLLEGVNRFCQLKGCTSLIITHPLDVMISILSKLGFKNYTISKNLIGKSLGGEDKHFKGFNTCFNCLGLDLDFTHKFTGGIPVSFELFT